MKKVLAVVLAMIMTFSLASASFAAELRVEQTAGKFYVVAQNEHVEAGKTYSIPVSIVSDYTPYDENGLEITSGEFVTGFNVSALGGGIEILGIKESDEIKNYAGGYELCECQYNAYNDLIATFTFKVNDLGLLHQQNFVIAYIDIKVADDYVTGDDGLAEAGSLDVTASDLSWCVDANPAFDYCSGASGIRTTDGQYHELEYLGDTTKDNILFTAGHYAGAFSWDPEPEPTFWEKVVATLKNVALKVVDFLITALSLAKSYLNGELG